MKKTTITQKEFDERYDKIQESFKASDDQMSGAGDHFNWVDGSAITVEDLLTTEFLDLVEASLDIIINK